CYLCDQRQKGRFVRNCRQLAGCRWKSYSWSGVIQSTQHTGGTDMETQELHRGRLIDHVQLVVRDLSAAQGFYTAIADVLNIPIGCSGDGVFWIDVLVVSAPGSEAALGELTGRQHLAFQAEDRVMVEAVYRAALDNGGRNNGSPGLRRY